MELPEQDRQAFIEAARRRGVTGKGGAAFGVMPSSGKRPKEPEFPPGSSVLDVPIGGKERLTDTVLRRRPEPEASMTALPAPSMAQRHARSLEGYLTPKMGGPRARTVSQSLLGGQESVLPFGIGLQEFVPFSPYVGEEAGAMIREGQETDSGLTTGLGLGLGALQALPVAKPLARGAKAAGRALGPKAAEMAEGYLLKSGLAPQLTAYHGTPHKFSSEEGAPLGKFKAEKIGTGEGAQAYGHGIYFAESPDVARSYQKALTFDGFKIKMKDGSTQIAARSTTDGFDPGAFLTKHGGDYDAAIKDAESNLGSASIVRQLKTWKQNSVETTAFGDKGSLYTVDIPDEMIPRMLDWDKPLKEQDIYKSGLLREIAEDAGLPIEYSKRALLGNRTGEDLYHALGSAKYASDYLKSWKVPGIKYLDSQSRGPSGTGRWRLDFKDGTSQEFNFKPNDDVLEQMGATATPIGTRNFVIFPGEEQKLRILQRNEEKLPDPADMIKSMEEEAKAIAQGMRNRAKADRAAGLDQISDETLLKNREDSERIHKLMVQVEELKRPQVKIAEEKPDPSWIEGLPDAQRKTVKSFDEWQGDRGFSLRKAGSNPEDDLHTSAQSNFTDYEVVPKVRSIPLDALGGLGGYDSPKELARIKNLAQQIEGNKEITPIFVGVDATGVPYVIEGQHRARAFKNLGMQSIPAKVIVDMTPEIVRAEGGLVTDTDAIAAKLKSTGMDDQKAFMQALRMADARQEAHMAGGGLAKLLKGAKTIGNYQALPLNLPRAPNLPPQEITKTAERVARQQMGQHVRQSDKIAANLAGRSVKEADKLQKMQVDIQPTKEVMQSVVVPEEVGQVRIALPGDISVADQMLMEVEGLPIGSVQEGGAKYGLGKQDLDDPRFWASNEGPAQIFQNKVTDLSYMYETPEIMALHLAMGHDAMNFAQHFADANLLAIQASNVHPKAAEMFNKMIREGYEKINPKTKEKVRITFPDFPGIEDYQQAYKATQENPELRKWFNDRMKKESITTPLGIPSGKEIEYAIMEPALRNMEHSMTGLSVGRMKPGASLIPGSSHKTYSHDIAGQALGHTKELTPIELAFPDASAYIKSTKRPQDFTPTIQKLFPHQVVDEQYINQLGEYYNRLKQIRGYKKGGEVKKTGLSVLNEAII
jgi:hypothetical protein